MLWRCGIHMRIVAWLWRPRTTFSSWFFPSTLWVVGIELRLSSRWPHLFLLDALTFPLDGASEQIISFNGVISDSSPAVLGCTFESVEGKAKKTEVGECYLILVASGTTYLSSVAVKWINKLLGVPFVRRGFKIRVESHLYWTCSMILGLRKT